MWISRRVVSCWGLGEDAHRTHARSATRLTRAALLRTRALTKGPKTTDSVASVRVHVCMCAGVYACVYACVRACVCVVILLTGIAGRHWTGQLDIAHQLSVATRNHTHMHTHTHTHTHTRTHTHPHTYTPTNRHNRRPQCQLITHSCRNITQTSSMPLFHTRPHSRAYIYMYACNHASFGCAPGLANLLTIALYVWLRVLGGRQHRLVGLHDLT